MILPVHEADAAQAVGQSASTSFRPRFNVPHVMNGPGMPLGANGRVHQMIFSFWLLKDHIGKSGGRPRVARLLNGMSEQVSPERRLMFREVAVPRRPPCKVTRSGFPVLVSLLIGCGGFNAPAFAAVDPLSPEAKSAAAAQAQELQRQQTRERSLRQQQEAIPDVRLRTSDAAQGPTAIPIQESPCFPILQISLKGDGAEQFRWALSRAYRAEDEVPVTGDGRCLGNVGINLVMKRIQNAIIDRGFVTTRVVADAQDLRSGTLQLTLVPGRVRLVRFVNEPNHGTAWNAVALRRGQLLNLRDIEQALENFKRLPTAEADIQITAAEGEGAQPGDSDLVIAWQQGFPLRLNVSVDDAGTKATGKYQASLTAAYDHPLRLNDLFYVSLNRDLGGGNEGKRGSKGGSIHYSVPYGSWLLGYTNSRSDYQQTVVGKTLDYLYSGDSLTQELKLSHLLYRDAKRKTTISAAGWTRRSHNFIDGFEVETQRRRVSGWDLGLGHREFRGDSIIDAHLNYKRGTGAFKAEQAPEELFGQGTSRMKLVTADVQIGMPFKIGERRFQYTGVIRGQRNQTRLVPQDLFSIGGRYSVRGFDGEAVLSAERGWLVRNDLGTAVGGFGMETYLGLDYGQVSGPSSQLLAGKQLAGAVLGLRGAYKAVTYDVFVGAPIHKPDQLQGRQAVTGFSVGGSF